MSWAHDILSWRWQRLYRHDPQTCHDILRSLGIDAHASEAREWRVAQRIHGQVYAYMGSS